MDLQEFVAVPANRERIRSVATLVLLELEPGGAELKLGYMEPLIDLAALDEVILMDRWDVAGRFGSTDLLGPMVIYLVVQALARGNQSIAREEIKKVVLRARSGEGSRRIGEIERAVNRVLELRQTRDERHAK